MNKTPLIVTAVAALGFSAVAALAYSPAPADGHATALSSTSSAAPASIVLAQNSDQSSDSDKSGGTDQPAPSTQGDDEK